MWYYLLFFFVTVGAKLVMALVMIYYLLPADRSCSECDEETLLLGAEKVGRVRARLFLGRVQWRWCPRCGWEGMTRRVGGPAPPLDRPLDSATRTTRRTRR